MNTPNKTIQQLRYRTIFQHLLFWLIFIGYQVISNGWNDTDEFSFSPDPWLFLLTLPVTILLTYVNLYVLMPVWLYRQKVVLYIAALLALLLAGGLTMRFFTYLLVVPWERLHNPARYLVENKHFWIPVRILRISLETYPVIAVTTLIQLMRKAYDREKDLRELEKEKYSAEMGLLKAQINPHFFFNTLNSLYALILKGSDQASKVVLRLSALMHYMLYDAGTDKVLLTDEISHLENYIGIEQMRFSGRLDLSFQYSGDIPGKMIAPLLLLTLVENAFKHGIAEEAGWITIDLKVTGNRLFLNVENSYPESSNVTRGGIGLNNLKRRLELIYPHRYTLQFDRQSQIFKASLKLDL